MIPRVVFDTNVVLSALLFRAGRLAWLRSHWASGRVVPLVSADTVTELVRVLAYPRFGLSQVEIEELLCIYLPFAEPVSVARHASAPRCRDAADQKFVDLALAGRADILVTGDKDLLALGKAVPFSIEKPEPYARRP